MFGWKHDYFLEQQTWSYIIQDIMLAYSSGFY